MDVLIRKFYNFSPEMVFKSNEFWRGACKKNAGKGFLYRATNRIIDIVKKIGDFLFFVCVPIAQYS